MGGVTRARMPLNNERIYAPYKIAALVEVLAERGIAPEASLRGSGVSPEKIHDASALTSVRQYAIVCQNAESLSCAADTPFKVGARLHPRPEAAIGAQPHGQVTSGDVRAADWRSQSIRRYRRSRLSWASTTPRLFERH